MESVKASKNTQKVLTEIPENLKRLTLILVKIFYGNDYFVICDFIQRKVIIKEDDLRDLCKIDQRQLRKFLIPLKVDKIIKERLVPEEVDGKLRKINYLFVNYKAVINVAKYKIDHIRQKLEVREKDDVHKAYYRCTGENCKRQYHAMDIGKIYDPFTQEMRCWQCKSSVEPDESGGPSTITRSSMAKFNEQMAGIFVLLKEMDDVRFARELLEPVIQSTLPKMEGEIIDLNTKIPANLGHRSFARVPRSDLYGSSITVSIGDNVEAMPETKIEIPWLQRQQHGELNPPGPSQDSISMAPSTVHSQASMLINNIDEKEEPATSQANDYVQPKRPRKEEIADLLRLEEEEHPLTPTANGVDDREEQDAEKPDKGENEAIFVRVQGELVSIDDIDEAALGRMSESEKTDYYERMQGAYVDYDYY